MEGGKVAHGTVGRGRRNRAGSACTGEGVEDSRFLLGVVKGKPVGLFTLDDESVLAPPEISSLDEGDVRTRGLQGPPRAATYVPRTPNGRRRGTG